jgi:hypothetical protein
MISELSMAKGGDFDEKKDNPKKEHGQEKDPLKNNKHCEKKAGFKEEGRS